MSKILNNSWLAFTVGLGLFIIVFLLLDILIMNMQGLSLIFNG